MSAITGLSVLMAGARRADPTKEPAPPKASEPEAGPPAADNDAAVILGKVTLNLFVGYDAGGRMQDDLLTSLLTTEQRKQKDEDDNVLRQLDAARQNQKSDRREALMQKMEQIKKQLAMLRMLATFNPEAAAKQAARLSRELAKAAKEYADAGAEAGAAASPPAAAKAAVPGDAAAAASGGDEAAAPDAAAAKAAPEQKAAEGQTDKAEAEQGDADQAAPAAAETPPASGSALGKEDDTIAEAKKLARQLKIIFEMAKEEAARRGERDRDIERADRTMNDALGDIDKADWDLRVQDGAAASGPVAIDAAPAPAPAPSVSILV